MENAHPVASASRPVNVTVGRPREYLTEREVEKLMDAARGNRWGHRDATAILRKLPPMRLNRWMPPAASCDCSQPLLALLRHAGAHGQRPLLGRDRTQRGHRPLGHHLRHCRNRNPADGLLPRRDVLSFGSSQAGSVHALASIQNNSGPSQGLAGRPAAG